MCTIVTLYSYTVCTVEGGLCVLLLPCIAIHIMYSRRRFMYTIVTLYSYTYYVQ